MLLDLIFPKHCYGCHQIGEYFCQNCQSQLKTLPVYTKNTDPFSGRLSVFKYRRLIKKAITDLKYNFITDLVADLATLASSKIISDYPHLLDYWRQNNFYFHPIPLHPFRQNLRGFNQADLLGQLISRNLGLKYINDLFWRSRFSLPQASLKNKMDRRLNIADSFILNPSAKCPSHLILFDDVCTTFSTLKSSASIFKNTSVTEFWAMTLAA